MTKRFILLSVISVFSIQVLAANSSSVFDHNSKIGMCAGLSQIAKIPVSKVKLTQALDRTDVEEKVAGAMSYGGGYAMGMIDMYKKFKPKTNNDAAIAKQIFEQTGCSVYKM